MTYVAPSVRTGRNRTVDLTSITLVAGEHGTAKELTAEVRRLLAERKVTYTEVHGRRVARRSMALPAILVTFGDDPRQVTYEGFGRVVLDFLPLIAAD